MRFLLIFNPHASSGRAGQLLEPILKALETRGEVTALQTMRPGHARLLVAESDLGRFDGVLAAGGDGTLFEVLNGLYQHPKDRRVPLGVIPIGTGNAFARELGLQEGDWKAAVGIISAGEREAIDVGEVRTGDDSYVFLNIIGFGLPARAMATAEKLKKLGQQAYTLAVLREVMRLETHALDIEIDGQRIRQDNVFVEISNTRYTGTHFLIAPSAQWDDGLLDVTLLRRLPRRRLLRLFPTIYSGRHVQFEEVSTYQASTIKIHAPEGFSLVPDGEFAGETPAIITCLKRDLEIFCRPGMG